MPFARPTLPQLVTRIRSDFRGRLEIEGSLTRRAMADVLAVVWAGAVHLLHGHLHWLGRQLFPTTSERDALLKQASLYSIVPAPATYASGRVRATGVNGSSVPANSVLVRDDGVTYRLTSGAVVSGGRATVEVEAAEAGATGNVDAGDSLAFESPLTGIDSNVTVIADGIGGGFDAETTEGTRGRLFHRLREPPQGGVDHDYVAWALTVPGVTRVWVYPNENGLGTVVVRFARDEEDDIFPDAAQVAAVQQALVVERPITAEVTAVAPIRRPLDLRIAVTPDTPETRGAVSGEIVDLLVREAEPGNGAGRGTIRISRLQVAIGIAKGVEDFSVVLPISDIVPDVGELVTLRSILWG